MVARDHPTVGAGAPAESCCAPQLSQAAFRHPLDPLDGAEMARAAALLTEAFGKETPVRFERIEIEEPEKGALSAWTSGSGWDRQIRFSIYRHGRIGVTEGLLSLTEGLVLSSRHLPAARPMIMLEEFLGSPTFQVGSLRSNLPAMR